LAIYKNIGITDNKLIYDMTLLLSRLSAWQG